MVHHEFWKLIYFGSKSQRSRPRGTQNKSISVFRWNTILTLVAYVSYAGFSNGLMLLLTASCFVHGVLASGIKHWRHGS